ncbi:MAG: transketolase [Clostridia bacterium]|nr:transketolase [Clostridia bacterium]
MKHIDKLTVNTIRTLCADAIQKAKSGHPGMAIGSAPIALAIFEQLKKKPSQADWLGRDRFILSAGHASMLNYALLHLFGYDVSIDDIKSFRQFASKTAGHPEFSHTPGVEATTGPLGQGFAMAVGMAVAEKHLAAVFNREGYPVFNNHTFTLTGDGCIMEGVVSEAASFAGTMELGKLIAVYDCNGITIEGSTDITFTEDVSVRFTAYGWQVLNVADGEDIDAIRAAINEAKQDEKHPSLIIVHTNIAQGTSKQGSASSHGAPLGDDVIADWKKSLGWEYAPFEVPGEVKDHIAELMSENDRAVSDYDAMLEEYHKAYPELCTKLASWLDKKLPESLLNDDSLFDFEDKPIATRVCSGTVLNRLAERIENLFGGSADLSPTNMSEIKGLPYFCPETPEGRNVHYGIREFAMAAISNGLALYGGLRPYCAGFLVFADYLKPAARLSALMGLNVVYIMTHDSICVGEDGPTHQPIEQLEMLRSTPNTFVFRPADGKETAACYLTAMQLHAPAVLALSRQNLPQLAGSGRDALKGGYIISEAGDPKALEAVIIASGSEVSLAIDAQKLLEAEGRNVRVVSMPCCELFEKQSEEYRESVIPSGVRARTAVEALGGNYWHRYTGLDGEIVSMTGFGASAPGSLVYTHFGFTPENIAGAVRRSIEKQAKTRLNVNS